ncbi:MAG: pyrophosphate--fructose-6-phosphate 1-phosphotransferase [Chlamydiales bacterium]
MEFILENTESNMGESFMPTLLSPLQKARTNFQLALPRHLENIGTLQVEKGKHTESEGNSEKLKELFPHTYGQPVVSFSEGNKGTHAVQRVGVVLSGGQAPGGHNVIAGLFDSLKQLNSKSTLFGFLAGPNGIVVNDYVEITEELLSSYRNQGGFDIIGSGRDKIDTEEQLANAEKNCKALELDGLVIIGGDDSNTNAAMLAEYFSKANCKTRVIGVPKTIDGDLKNEQVETSFGFDTACKVYSELIGNLLRDCLSSKKYYHFVKLMGRSASHITLECSLQTHPNIAIISEEVASDKKTLAEITNEIADVICLRAEQGKGYGVVLVPEGLVEFVPEIKSLIGALNDILSPEKPLNDLVKSMTTHKERMVLVCGNLKPELAACFNSFPRSIQDQLLEDRDPHGNVQVSRIETEQLLIMTVASELESRKTCGKYKGTFSTQHHFLGYEARSSMPSNFDCHYCYALGFTATLLIESGLSGYMAVVKKLIKPVSDWEVGGVPLTSMMNVEVRQGKAKPVIQKALVDLTSNAFQTFKKVREKWSTEDLYRYPGPIQFYGQEDVTNGTSMTLQYEHSS